MDSATVAHCFVPNYHMWSIVNVNWTSSSLLHQQLRLMGIVLFRPIISNLHKKTNQNHFPKQLKYYCQYCVLSRITFPGVSCASVLMEIEAISLKWEFSEKKKKSHFSFPYSPAVKTSGSAMPQPHICSQLAVTLLRRSAAEAAAWSHRVFQCVRRHFVESHISELDFQVDWGIVLLSLMWNTKCCSLFDRSICLRWKQKFNSE